MNKPVGDRGTRNLRNTTASSAVVVYNAETQQVKFIDQADTHSEEVVYENVMVKKSDQPLESLMRSAPHRSMPSSEPSAAEEGGVVVSGKRGRR